MELDLGQIYLWIKFELVSLKDEEVTGIVIFQKQAFLKYEISEFIEFIKDFAC